MISLHHFLTYDGCRYQTQFKNQMIIRYLTSYFDQSKQMEIETNRLCDMKIANFLSCNGLIIDVLPFVLLNSLLIIKMEILETQ
jgi:hypothetical protein